jgi:hypothetical protein
MCRARYLPSVVLALLLAVACVPPGRAEDDGKIQTNLQAALTQLAEGIGKHLDSRKETTVVVGEFTGPGQAGPGIQEALRRALAALPSPKTAVPVAALEVRGSYYLDEDEEAAAKGDAGLAVLKVEAVFHDSTTGKPLTQLPMAPVRVRNSLDLGKLFAATIFFPPKAPEEKRLKDLIDRIKNPTVHIDGTRVSSRAQSPYAVEILVRPAEKANARGEPRAPNRELSRNGQAFVDIREGEAYEVRISNRSKQDVAVTLTIDGLDQFTFSEVRDEDGNPRYKQMIVEKPRPGQRETRCTIRGWHHRNKGDDAFFAFVVTEFGKGEASKLLKSPARVGTIVVTFAPAVEKVEEPPVVKAPSPSVRGSPKTESGDLADPAPPAAPKVGAGEAPPAAAPKKETGKGPPVAGEIEEAKRQVGPVEEIVSIRYSKQP